MKSFILILFSLSAICWAQTPPTKKLNILPDSSTSTATTLPSNSKTGDIDMNQFKNVPPAEKGPKVNVNVSCTMPDGSLRQQSEVGYKECMETNANRMMSQPKTPEANPNDPRKK